MTTCRPIKYTVSSALPVQEVARHYSVWSANVARINARTASNAASGASHRLGLTSHTDLTAEEFRAQYLGAPMTRADRTSPQHQHKHTQQQHSTTLHAASSWLSALWPGRQSADPTKKDTPQHWRYENVTAPASVDWRTHTPPVLGTIKDQHVNGTPCGSCWAFSSVSIMEISSAMATGGLRRQQVWLPAQASTLSAAVGVLPMSRRTFLSRCVTLSSTHHTPQRGRQGCCAVQCQKTDGCWVDSPGHRQSTTGCPGPRTAV